MGEPSRVLLVGDHELFHECLGGALRRRCGLVVVGRVADLSRAAEHPDAAGLDLVLVDLGRPDRVALERLPDLVRRHPGLRVVVLGLSDSRRDLLRCVEAGARGYVLQDAGLEELCEALSRVVAGEVYCSPRVTYSMFACLGDLAREERRRRQIDKLELTPREMEVLHLVAEGLTNRRIAERICLSIYTVKNHVHNILDKLGAERREEAVETAYRRGWLPERKRSTG